MTSPVSAIGNIHCICMQGTDARRFAQAQFAADVGELASQHWQWNAWLTAQGRVRALMHLVDPGSGTLLAVLRGGNAETTRTTLANYVLRMQVTLAVGTFTGRHGGPAPMGTARTGSGEVVLGYGARSLRLEPVPDMPPDHAAREGWRLEDIRQGWPNLPADEPEFLPPALGLEHLGAVSFDKGCYPGQEIAARLHHRGGRKHRLCLLHGPGPLPAGEIRGPDGAVSARILDAATGPGRVEALAVVPMSITCQINLLGNIYIVQHEFGA